MEKKITFTDPITGIVLMNAIHDSEGKLILPNKYYHVAKDPESGKIIIFKASKTDKK